MIKVQYKHITTNPPARILAVTTKRRNFSVMFKKGHFHFFTQGRLQSTWSSMHKNVIAATKADMAHVDALMRMTCTERAEYDKKIAEIREASGAAQ